MSFALRPALLRAGGRWNWPSGKTCRVVRSVPNISCIIQPTDGSMPLRNLFPESIFGRKLNPNAERRLRLSQARAEETIIRGHVDNALMFVDTLAEDLSFDRAIDTYIRVMGIPEPLASTVATRALVHLGRDLVPFRRRMQREGEDVAAEKPRLRLDEASRSQDIKRGA